MKQLYLLLFFSFTAVTMQSQQRVFYGDGTAKMQYGVSVNLTADVAFKKNMSNLRLGVASGVGFSLYDENFTSLNVEYSVALGGLGTYNNGNTSYFVIAPHFCQALYQNHFGHTNEALINNQPLYYFTDLITPPLQNPFQASVSVGANFIRFINRKQIAKWQRVAHLGIKANVVQFVYNNDGGFLMKYWGDKEDRYFTGCGFLRVHLNDNLALNDFGLSFYKFTGYNHMSFEVSDELLYSSVDYIDPNQNFFNRGFWSLQMGNSRYGEAFVRYNNPRNIREVQNFIHSNMGFGYHQSLTDSFYSFGASGSFYQTHIPGQ